MMHALSLAAYTVLMAATLRNEYHTMSIKIIDPHVHFFNLAEGQYSWLKGNPPAWPNLEKIKQPVSINQLVESTDFDLVAIVHIEAGFNNSAPINELNWLSTHLNNLPYKAISYAQIDQSPTLFSNALKETQHPALAGIRDITEGSDANRLLSNNCYNNFEYLSHLKLHFEAQFALENINITKQLAYYAKHIPQLHIIINHAGLPTNIPNWQQSVALLAQHENIAIKFSGFELLSLNQQQQAKCYSTLLKYFGEQRIMFASNYPVCQINSCYNDIWHAHFNLCNNPRIWDQLSNKNAKHFYQA